MQTGIDPEKRGMLLFMCKDISLKALHSYGGQGHWLIVIQKPDCCCSRKVACGFQKDLKQATEFWGLLSDSQMIKPKRKTV